MDARVEGTRRQLREAILELAARKDVESITVAELARAADIDRSTFYAHAASPVELLTAVLREDLDPLRVDADEVIERAPGGLAEVGAQLNGRLIEHLERYEQIYADRGGARPSSALHTVLSDHVRGSLELILGHLDALAVARGAQPTSELRRRYLAAFIAHGIVGAISVWLSDPAPRDRAQLETVLDLVYTTWLLPAAELPQ